MHAAVRFGQLAQSLDTLYDTLANELKRLNVIAMEPRETGRALQLPKELQKIPEREIDLPMHRGDVLGKGMFTVYKGWWQQGSSSSSLGSDNSNMQVAVKKYGIPEEDEDELEVEASELKRLFERVEQNACRQIACAHNN
eukprot:2569929-Amphidinium_carterae.1